jgi:hypothetical protein
MVLGIIGWIVCSPVRDWSSPVRVAKAIAKPASAWRQLQRLRASTVQHAAVMPRGLRRLVSQARLADRLPNRLAVIPYQLELAIAAGVEPTGAILQAYSAHQPATQRRYLEALTAEPEAGVLLAFEAPRWPALDGVATPARLPVIFRGLIEEFRPVFPDAAPGFLLLERRPEPRGLIERPLPLGEVRRSSGALSAALPSTTGCRLLELRLAIGYDPRLLFGRPARMELNVALEGGEVVSTRLVTLDRKTPFSVLVPLVSAERTAELWSPGPEPGPSLREVEIRVLAGSGLDRVLAVGPRRLELESVACLVP